LYYLTAQPLEFEQTCLRFVTEAVVWLGVRLTSVALLLCYYSPTYVHCIYCIWVYFEAIRMLVSVVMRKLRV